MATRSDGVNGPSHGGLAGAAWQRSSVQQLRDVQAKVDAADPRPKLGGALSSGALERLFSAGRAIAVQRPRHR
jgi:hypothetical protein